MATTSTTNLSGPQIVVPVDLAALIYTNQAPDSGASFVNMTVNYQELTPGFVQSEGCLGENLLPQQGTQFQSLPIGAHLRWKLPDALSQAETTEAGGVTYPVVPNRWLVVRSWVPQTNDQADAASLPAGPNVTTFVVQSDVLAPLSSTTNPYDSNSFYDGTQAADFAVAWPNLDPSVQATSLSSAVASHYLGSTTAPNGWAGETAPPVPTLTAVGPGDPSFAAYYWNCFGVFGFYDSLTDLPEGTSLPITISYMVVGWYSQSTGNPLDGLDAEADWVTQMQTLAWAWSLTPITAPPPAPSPLPNDVICQGVLYGVTWNGAEVPYQSGVPTDGTVQVGIGNTTTEALSALVASQPSLSGDVGMEVLLDALQYNQMSTFEGSADGTNELAEFVHDSEFQTTDGGIYWDIRAAAAAAGSGQQSSNGAPGTPPLPGSLSTSLALLNQYQLQSDLLGAQYQSLQRTVFTTWYEHILGLVAPPFQSNPWPPDSSIVSFIQDDLLGSSSSSLNLPSALTALNTAVANVNTQVTAINDALPSAMPGYELVSLAMQPYEQPTNPVVVLAGSGVAKSFTYGGDGRFRSDGALFCRVYQAGGAAPTIASITIPAGPYLATAQVISAQSLPSLLPAFPSIGAVPALVPALYTELVLLDVSLSGIIAQAALLQSGVAAPTAAQVASLQPSVLAAQNQLLGAHDTDLAASPTADPSTLPDPTNPAEACFAGFAGQGASPVGVVTWAPPWVPMTFLWNGTWNSSYSSGDNALASWQLDIQSQDDQLASSQPLPIIDYAWQGLGVITSNQLSVSGQIPLNPNTTINLASQIDQYLATVAGDPEPAAPNPVGSAPCCELSDAATAVANLQMVSQSLGGFNEALTMMSQTLQLSVIDPYDGALGYQVFSAVEPGAQGSSPSYEPPPVDGTTPTTTATDLSPLSSGPYYPVRAGWFQLGGLQLVDVFGQAQNMIVTGGASSPVVTSQQVTPPFATASNTLAQLAPRIAQPARLRFQLQSSAAPDSNPVLATSDPASTPICGWVLPNLLDASLMIYDAGGELLGELQALDGNFGSSVGGVRWDPAPGTNSPLGAAPVFEDAHLGNFVNTLIALAQTAEPGTNPLIDLLNAVDESLWTVTPLGGWQDPTLPFLIGRPLAVVRATLQIDLYGNPVYDVSPAGLNALITSDALPTSNFLDLQFPVLLGDTARSQDGVIGFFVGDDDASAASATETFSSFYLAWGGTMPTTPGTSYVQCDYSAADSPIQVGLTPGAPPVWVTMLVDPRAAAHAMSGILPAASVMLSSGQTAPALANMAVTFQVGPIVADSVNFTMPVPATTGGAWSFLTQPDASTWTANTSIQPVSASANLSSNPQELVDGWLKLAGDVEE